jgi:hypothetical protein
MEIFGAVIITLYLVSVFWVVILMWMVLEDIDRTWKEFGYGKVFMTAILWFIVIPLVWSDYNIEMKQRRIKD